MKTRTTIGDHTYGAPKIYGKAAHCRIGKFCSIGENVRIDIGNEHNPGNISTYPFNVLHPEAAGACTTHPLCRGDVVIGNDVWIGFDAIILSGTTIGDGAIIAANSVVRGEVEPYALYAGSLAEFKRFRFPESDRGLLMAIRWWDWPDEWIFMPEVAETLMSGDVEGLYVLWLKLKREGSAG
jgi:virginiamycin A acetyltransferase